SADTKTAEVRQQVAGMMRTLLGVQGAVQGAVSQAELASSVNAALAPFKAGVDTRLHQLGRNLAMVAEIVQQRPPASPATAGTLELAAMEACVTKQVSGQLAGLQRRVVVCEADAKQALKAIAASREAAEEAEGAREKELRVVKRAGKAAQEQAVSLFENVTELRASIAEISSTVSSHREKLGELKGMDRRVGDVSEKVMNAIGKMQAEEGAHVKQLTALVAQEKREWEEQRCHDMDKGKAMGARLSSACEQLERLESGLRSAENKVLPLAHLPGSVECLESDVGGLKRDVGELQRDVGELKAAAARGTEASAGVVEAAGSEREALRSNIEALRGDLSEMQRDTKAWQSEVEDHRELTEALREQGQELGSQVRKIESDNKTLADQLEAIRGGEAVPVRSLSVLSNELAE
ncbi:unnamed protein product, partial [Chrysoparadoxa australica]